MAAVNIVSFISVNTNGRQGGGAITVTGVKVGDVIISAYNTNDNDKAINFFQPVVSTDDQIQQTDGSNYSSTNFQMVLLRP